MIGTIDGVEFIDVTKRGRNTQFIGGVRFEPCEIDVTEEELGTVTQFHSLTGDQFASRTKSGMASKPAARRKKPSPTSD